MSQALLPPSKRNDILLLLSSCPEKDAQAIARALLEQKLCACIHLGPTVKSLYWWKGHIEEASEVSLLIKSLPSLKDALIQSLKKLHPYETPELVFLDAKAEDDYASWLNESLK